MYKIGGQRMTDQDAINLWRRHVGQQRLYASGMACQGWCQLIGEGANVVQYGCAPCRNQAKVRRRVDGAAKLAGMNLVNDDALALQGFGNGARAGLRLGCQTLGIGAILPPQGGRHPLVGGRWQHGPIAHVKYKTAIA